MLHRATGRGTPVGDVQLAEDLPKMHMDRPTAKEELVGDLGIGPSSGRTILSRSFVALIDYEFLSVQETEATGELG